MRFRGTLVGQLAAKNDSYPHLAATNKPLATT